MVTHTASRSHLGPGYGVTITLSLFLVVLATLMPTLSAAQTNERCFPETGYCISGSIRQYWERNGGLPVFGYPISPLKVELVEGSWTGPVQAAEWAPALSPDGARVAFVSDRAGSADIFVMNSDGSGSAVNLTSYGQGSAQYAPAWSPDGTRIAFVSDEGGLPNIWVMRADGSERYSLTSEPNKRHNNPAWSPDSSRIVYEFDFSTRDQDIEYINADGTGKRTVVNLSASETNPSWSADGSSIAFERDGDFLIVGISGAEPFNLTNSGAVLDRAPAWGP